MANGVGGAPLVQRGEPVGEEHHVDDRLLPGERLRAVGLGALARGCAVRGRLDTAPLAALERRPRGEHGRDREEHGRHEVEVAVPTGFPARRGLVELVHHLVHRVPPELLPAILRHGLTTHTAAPRPATT